MTRMTQVIPYCLGLFLGTFAQAHQILDPSQVLSFSISKEGMTRISIENDGIEDIYAYPLEFADNIQQHKSGHAFVVAEDLTSPLFVTIITKRGVAQDLKLTPTSKKVEPILLKFENEETKTKEVEEEASGFLTSFVQGIVPAGFYAVHIEETSRSGGSLIATVESAHQNARYRVITYTVKGESERKEGAVSLDNRLLWDSRDLAASFDRPQLEGDQQAKLYVIQKL